MGEGVIVGVKVAAGVEVIAVVGETVGTSVSVGIGTKLLQEVSRARNTSAERTMSDLFEEVTLYAFLRAVMITAPMRL